MIVLILGLLIFLGVHSTRLVADDWRTAQIAHRGERPWKGLYALASLVGLVLIVWGFGQARVDPIVIWNPPAGMRHVTALLVLAAFVLIAATYVPANHIKAAVGHPMVLGVKLWAFAHLLSNGRLADVLLFGAFLIWAAASFAVSRRRDRLAGTTYPAGTVKGDVIVAVAGVAGWALFALYLHLWLIGVRAV